METEHLDFRNTDATVGTAPTVIIDTVIDAPTIIICIGGRNIFVAEVYDIAVKSHNDRITVSNRDTLPTRVHGEEMRIFSYSHILTKISILKVKRIA